MIAACDRKAQRVDEALTTTPARKSVHGKAQLPMNDTAKLEVHETFVSVPLG